MPLTNFTFKFLCKVMTPSGLGKDFYITGFVVEVTYGTGTDVKTGLVYICISHTRLYVIAYYTIGNASWHGTCKGYNIIMLKVTYSYL